VEQHQVAFSSMIKIEQEWFGEQSYFAIEQIREGVDVERDDASEGSDTSMGSLGLEGDTSNDDDSNRGE
jgi:hypothetical protein